MRPAPDPAPADWVVDGIGPFGSGVGGLVPGVFEAYARVLHPAWADDEPVRWAEVAAWSGRAVHPLAQFHTMMSPASGCGAGPRPWNRPPDDGSMPPATLAALCDVLAAHTNTPETCWFCVLRWYDESAPEPPPESADGPMVELPRRTYLLLAGPLKAAGELRLAPLTPQSPSLFWPDDHTWCVATDVDLDSTYLGGSAALVADLLADERLEVFATEVTGSVWATSDDVNR
jgi:hypothetical protein